MLNQNEISSIASQVLDSDKYFPIYTLQVSEIPNNERSMWPWAEPSWAEPLEEEYFVDWG